MLLIYIYNIYIYIYICIYIYIHIIYYYMLYYDVLYIYIYNYIYIYTFSCYRCFFFKYCGHLVLMIYDAIFYPIKSTRALAPPVSYIQITYSACHGHCRCHVLIDADLAVRHFRLRVWLAIVCGSDRYFENRRHLFHFQRFVRSSEQELYGQNTIFFYNFSYTPIHVVC